MKKGLKQPAAAEGEGNRGQGIYNINSTAPSLFTHSSSLSFWLAALMKKGLRVER